MRPSLSAVVAFRAMATLDSPIPPQLGRRLERWLLRWETPVLVEALRVEFSPRLVRAFGRCYQQDRLIRLTPSLLGSQLELLPEILCHEAAHAAVYERHGAGVRPHGAEWKGMMRSAGFDPRVRIPVVVDRGAMLGDRKRAVFQHRCPVCDLSRPASRPMPTWRCRACVQTASRGRLQIRREQASEGRGSGQRLRGTTQLSVAATSPRKSR